MEQNMMASSVLLFVSVIFQSLPLILFSKTILEQFIPLQLHLLLCNILQDMFVPQFADPRSSAFLFFLSLEVVKAKNAACCVTRN